MVNQLASAYPTPTKSPLTRLLPLCLFLAVVGEVAQAQTPVVSDVSISGGPGSGDTFELAEDIVVDVTFDRWVRANGRVQLALRIGTQTRYAEPRFFHRSEGA